MSRFITFRVSRQGSNSAGSFNSGPFGGGAAAVMAAALGSGGKHPAAPWECGFAAEGNGMIFSF
jgi:hypothetical protein